MQPVNIGIVGCGAISKQYLNHAKNFPILNIAALADLDIERAKAKVEEHGVGRACSVDEMLADESIEIVLNLTIPKAHLPVALQAIEAGKHVYNEKPLGANRAEGEQIMQAADAKGLQVGCAPDTFLGAGHQTARKMIDDGAIGKPVAGTAFMMGAGHESWHPNPFFYYEPGGGPMFDMGPYYITALMHMLGPVRRVQGAAAILKPERTVTAEPNVGAKITVETPDHIAGLLEFESGAVVTVVTSFAVIAHPHPPITIFGSEASLGVPDPNGFDGKVTLCAKRGGEWEEQPMTHCEGYGRASGLADMAMAIRTGRGFRANGHNALAALDVMQGFLEASETGQAYQPKHRYTRPAPMPTGLELGALD